MENSEHHSQIQELEKTIRVLQKKLKRSEKEREQIESDVATKEALLKNVIHELQTSQTALQQKSQDLQNAMEKMKMMQVQLVHSEKMSSLGQVVAGVAHEINNPVGFIHGNLTYVEEYTQDLINLLTLYQEHYPENPKAIQSEIDRIEPNFLIDDLQKIIGSMSSGTTRIQKIVESLRLFSRLDEAEVKMVDIHLDLDSTLMILHHRLHAQSGCSEIKVIKEYGCLPQIECYPRQLNQVFLSILSNAIDALEDKRSNPSQNTSNAPTIQIQTQALSEQEIMIVITDNGSGIPEDIHAKVFDPFFTTKPIGKGTGLGLSVSYQIIVDQHRGKLECHSTPDQGTEFIMMLPVDQPEFAM
jgi:two-component system NtrC family sensor kinase